MKVFIVTALLFLLATESLKAQNYGGQYYQVTPQDGNGGSDPYQRQGSERKVRSYTRMKHWGLGLLAGGGFSVVTGILLVATNPPVDYSTYNSYYNGYYYTYNVNPPSSPAGYVAGVFLIEAGALAVIPGAIFTIIGISKVNQYKTKTSGLSWGLAPKGKGLSLTYTF